MLTQKQLKKLLSYNPTTGVFTWLESRGSVAKGTEANGIQIHILGKVYSKRREKGISSGYAYPVSTTCRPKESGAAMRASMDLTRALANFRRS